jgi:hypothetical protein
MAEPPISVSLDRDLAEQVLQDGFDAMTDALNADDMEALERNADVVRHVAAAIHQTTTGDSIDSPRTVVVLRAGPPQRMMEGTAEGEMMAVAGADLVIDLRDSAPRVTKCRHGHAEDVRVRVL